MILQRIKSINLKRRTLVISLIVAEAIGIIALIWYLRTPLTQKFIFTPPKAYSLVTMDPKKRYLISQGDYIRGKGIPNTEIKALFTPGLIKITASVDQKGSFNLQIPTDIDPKTYRLTIANYDRVNNLAFSKGYRIRIQSNNRLLQNPFIQKILNSVRIKKAQALDGTPGTDYDWNRVVGPEWKDWMKLWHQAGICPAIDDSGEILTYMNKEAYDELYGPLYTCPAIESLKGWLDEIAYDKGFFVDLWFELIGRGYSEEAFIDYFPDWKTFVAENRPSNAIIVRPIGIDRKDSIDENTFIQIMYDVAVERKYQERSSLLKIFLNSTDPVLGLRGPYNVVTGYKFTNGWDYVDGLLFILSFAKAPQAGVKAGVAVTEKNITAMTLKREAIVRDGSILTQAEMADSAVASIGKQTKKSKLPFGGHKIKLNLKPKPLTLDDSSLSWSALLRLVDEGRAAVLDPEVARPYAERLYQNLEKFFPGQNILPNKEEFLSIPDSGWIFIVKPEVIEKAQGNFHKTAGGLAFGKVILINEESGLDGLLEHELIHSMAWMNSLSRQKPGYPHNQDQINKVAQLFSIIYEIGTDAIVERIYGHASGYKGDYPVLYSEIEKLIAVIDNPPGNIPLPETSFWQHIYEFAVTDDAWSFYEKLLKQPGAVKQLLDKVDTDKLERLSKEWAEADQRALASQVSVGTLTSLAAVLYNREYIYNQLTGRNLEADSDPNKLIMLPMKLGQDLGILKDGDTSGPEGPDYFKINNIAGDYSQGSVLETSVIASLYGENFDLEGYSVVWAIEESGSDPKNSPGDVNPVNNEGSRCGSSCSIVIPSDINPGRYLIRAYLLSGQDKILTSDAYPVEISSASSAQAVTPSGESNSSAAVCDPSNWKDEKPYSCQDGWACYYRWKIAGGTSCDPERDYGEDGQHFVCLEDSDCRTLEPGGDS